MNCVEKIKTCNKLKYGPCWILLGVISAMCFNYVETNKCTLDF